jgi:hypothetical protein
MTRKEAVELLEKFSDFIFHDKEFLNSDWYEGDLTAIDAFLEQDWAKEKLPIESFRKGKFKGLNIHMEKLATESIVQKMMKDPEFKSKIEELAQKISDNNK